MKSLILSVIFSMVALVGSHTFASAQPQLSKDNIDEIVAAMTLEEKVDMVIGCGMAMGDAAKFPGTAGRTRDIPRLGIPSAYMADGPHKLAMSVTRSYDSNFYYSTEFPSGTTVAATFDPQAAFAVGQAIGEELKDYGLDIHLAPGLNIMRSSLCGRNHEYYSEDPVVTGKIAAAYINGVQSNGIGSTMKHFAVNNQETNRNANDSRLDQRPLREIYLKGFEIAVKDAQPWAIMTAYNKVNGKYTCEDVDLTENILRGDWGFRGVVMTDWNAGTDAVASMVAGNDMLQPGQQRQRQAILDAARNGSLDIAILDRNVKRILEFVVKSRSFAQAEYPNETDLKAHAAVDRKVGAEGIVLLQNNGALPFAKSVKSVALYGSSSYVMAPAGQGFGSTTVGRYSVSLVEGLRKAGYSVDNDLVKQYTAHIAAEQKKNYPDGLPPFSLQPLLRAGEFVPTAEELSAQIAANDIAVITLARTCGEAADRPLEEFYLKGNEAELIKTVAEAYHAAGKQVVVVLNVCGPIETASWKAQVDAILCPFQPGQEVGHCISDVLSGKVNPSGKLPMTFEIAYGDAPADDNFPYDYVFKMPSFATGSGLDIKGEEEEAPKGPVRNVDYTEYQEGIYVGYRYFDSFGQPVSFPFGFGLSYTDFDYEIVSSSMDEESCEMQVKVTNSGSVAGREAVQVYIKAPKGKLDKPAKELKAFAKTGLLAPGQSEVVTLRWNTMDMSSFNEKKSAWELQKGEYEWMAAASSADVRCSVKQKVAKTRYEQVSNSMAPQQKIAPSPKIVKK